jgi:hypothetical protein
MQGDDMTGYEMTRRVIHMVFVTGIFVFTTAIMSMAVYHDLEGEFFSYPDVVGHGDTLRFGARVRNEEFGPVKFDGWITAFHDIPPTFTFFRAKNVRIGGYQERTHFFRFVVPSFIDPGPYVITGYVGVHPFEVWERDHFFLEVIQTFENHGALFACDGAGPGPGKQALVVYDVEEEHSFQVDMEERIRGVGVSPDNSLAICAGRYGRLYFVDTGSWTVTDTLEVLGSTYLGDGVAFSEDGTKAAVHEHMWNLLWVFDTADPPDSLYPVSFWEPALPEFDDLTIVNDTMYMIDYGNDLLWYADIMTPELADTVSIPGAGDPVKPTAVKCDRTGKFLITVSLGSGPYFGSLSFFHVGGDYPEPLGYLSVDTGNPPGLLNYRGPTDIDLATATVDYMNVEINTYDEVIAVVGENAGTPGGCGGVYRLSSLLDRENKSVLVPDLATAIGEGKGKLFLPFPSHETAQPISDCALTENGVFLSCSEVGATRADVAGESIPVHEITVSGEPLDDPDDVCVMGR